MSYGIAYPARQPVLDGFSQPDSTDHATAPEKVFSVRVTVCRALPKRPLPQREWGPMAITLHSKLMTGTVLASSMTLLALSGAAYAQDGDPVTTEKKGRVTLLDRITISATRVKGAVIDALAAESSIDEVELERIQPNTAADIFRTTPGVAASMNGDDPATAINIRGLQQYGRVVVTLDGARQDYWRVLSSARKGRPSAQTNRAAIGPR